MGDHLYRVAPEVPRSSEPVPPRTADDFIIPIVLLAVGILFLAINVWGGEANSTEGGLGVLGVVFGAWALSQELRRPRP